MRKVLICGSRSIDDANLDNYISHLKVDEAISGKPVYVFYRNAHE